MQYGPGGAFDRIYAACKGNTAKNGPEGETSAPSRAG